MINRSLKFIDHLPRYRSILSTYCHLGPTQEYEKIAKSIGDKIISNEKIYQFVSDNVGVPWSLIGALHSKEASMDFSKCLHNGQPWNIKTTIVPKGRGPFKSWEESAIDALSLKKNIIDTMVIKDNKWSFEQCLWFAEGYNGWGYYLYRNINSPYVWCGTDAYEKGGYTKDGVFDKNHVVKNTGIAAILFMMQRYGYLDLSVNNELIHLTDVRPTAEDFEV